MEIQVLLFWAVVIILFINTIIEHLFNWCVRECHELLAILIIFYILKTVTILSILHIILN